MSLKKGRREVKEGLTFDFRTIKMSLCLILLLQFIAITEQLAPIVKEAEDVTLPCENVEKDQYKCNRTKWIFRVSEQAHNMDMVIHGPIKKLNLSKSKSDRFIVTENCSLIIKNVTDEDAGRYSCRQFNKSGNKQGEDFKVYLSVVTMLKQKSDDKVTAICSLSTFKRCNYTVKWLFNGKEEHIDEEVKLNTSQSLCSANVTIKPSSKNDESLRCEVTRASGKMEHFTFEWKTPSDWWQFVVGPVCLAALVITVVTLVLVRWRRTKGNKSVIDKNMVWGGGGDTVIYYTVQPHSSLTDASTDANHIYATVN
ncbi:pregnancy-specific beta-1-glycoprotein 5-like isoform X2 [Channa argus]|uniref:pregnancy-specific beta-1-glycoprotein 5-like isoform X2 n=1 Tax=Channa argus TaxID=215402 RepID=UPI003521FA1B